MEMDKDTFRRFGHMFVDWVAEYFENVGEYPVLSPLKPGDVRRRLPDKAPEQSETMEEIFEDFKKIVLPGITHWQHPSWFAYFPATNSPPSVLAEILTAGLGAQCMVWLTSPAAAELEEVVLDWLRRMLDLPDGFSGVIQDTASTATLVALITSRERATGYRSNKEGLREPLAVYVSEEAHSSVEKGAKIAGFGADFVRRIPADERFAMIPDRLKTAILEDEQKGVRGACVVATVGTTSSAGLDPLKSIGEICRAHDLWLHVDAAYAGTAAILPEKRWILEGVEFADSLVFNPHKWMLTNFDCSAHFVRDHGALIRTFEIHPEYLKTGLDAEVRNYRDWGIQLGRRFRALKLWFVLRSYGVLGLQHVIREHIRLAGLFRARVVSDALFELMAPVDLSLVCFRLNDGRPEEELDALNKALLDKLNATGKLLMSQTILKGRYVLRMSIGSRTTREEHVEAAWALISSTARSLL